LIVVALILFAHDGIFTNSCCLLHTHLQFKETITFNAYGVQDIIGILEARIGRSVVDKNAMEFIGRKISNESGDARKALKLAAMAVQICLDKLPKNKGDKTTPGPLVKTMHAHLANRSSHERLNERIGGLPTFTKGVLCVLSALGHEDAISVTCGRLRGFCAACMSHENDIPTAEDFRVSIETLVEMGLLRMDKVHARRAFGPGASIMALDSAPLRLGVQSEDVESAIIQELGQTPFFMRMREIALEKKEELLHGSE
jgi:Cdc6-like AAA superfamily ATPase